MRLLVYLFVAAGLVACGDDSATGGSSSSNGGSGGSGADGAGSEGGAPGGGGGSTPDGGSASTGGSGGGTVDVCAGPKPGPDNTGVPAGAVLTPSGSIEVTEDGAIIEDLDIQGEITVLADNVTIRRVKITSSDYYPIRYFDNDNVGLVVEDSEFDLASPATAAISFTNYTARRLNIHGSADGLKADANVLVEDCWIHDLSNLPEEHNDSVQSTGGKGVTLRHNVLEDASNAAVQTGDEGAATEDLTIECNWLYGGGWTLNIRGTPPTEPKNTRIIDNRFGRDAGYGPYTIDDLNPTIEGNVYDDNDEPID